MLDTHCHIDDPEYLTDLDAVITRQREAGVSAILVPGVDASSCTSVLNVCAQYPDYLYPALGLHPENTNENYQAELNTIHDVLFAPFHRTNRTFIAVGEIGLDYHFSTEFKDQQQDAFRQQLQWALELDLPIMLHARDATEDTLRILQEVNANSLAHGGKPLRGVAHCFSAPYEVASEYIRAGFYIGIGGVITFKNCKLADMLAQHPEFLPHILLETDAPYMTPVPYRGQPNESRYMTFVAQRLADAFKMPVLDVIEATTANAKRLFGPKIQKN